MRVCVIGTGYVGTVTAACFAHVGHDVVGLEQDPDKVAKLKAGELPFVEPDCATLLGDGLDAGRLRFTESYEDAIPESDVVFICVGTPLTETGDANVDALRDVVTNLAPLIGDRFKTIVTKSTVPVGSGDWITMLIEDAMSPSQVRMRNFGVVSNPEFLREGSAVADFLYPDRIVLGSSSQDALDQVALLYDTIVRQDFTDAHADLAPIPLIRTTLESAELIKYAANAFLATKISFINEIANICERIGGDIEQVAEGIGLDRRIGNAFLSAGIGWGGSCFRKDILALTRTAEEYGFTPTLLRSTVDVNEAQRLGVIRKLQDELKILKGKRIGLLGLSFKPDTDDLRDAPSLTLIERLDNAGCRVGVTDPVVTSLGEPFDGVVTFHTDVEDLADGVDALVLVTEWPEYRDLNLDKLAARMRTKVIIDGRNALDGDAIRRAGFRYVGVGRS
ncbi:MAG: UDP-glucose/GDP-mannose dehydrogenase family protein [Acidimicrobiia bacterium]|nr:UDP-glucose/GDP-mannose dehydrogenase family protein [Acidimicrobiia bacterium]